MDISRADVAAAREAIGRNRDMISGVKARLSRDVTGSNDLEVLRRSQEVASAFDLPVMIHMGQTVSPLPKLLALLKRRHLLGPPGLRANRQLVRRKWVENADVARRGIP